MDGRAGGDPSDLLPPVQRVRLASSTTVTYVSTIRLDQVSLVVSDVDASRAFYTRFGLGFGDERDPEWGAHHVSAPRGDASDIDVELDSTTSAASWDRGWPGGTGFVLGFKVETSDEVDRLVAELVADGVTVQQPPWDAFWGGRYAVVSDPDGNAVGIMGPIDDDRRSTPPPPS
jgi:catechol 2,3-dioxygenase-like lactoylglutathione lyase family enzyme